MLEKFDGGTLFVDTESPWLIRPLQDYQDCLVDRHEHFIHFIDLKDGRCIAYGFVSRSTGDFGTINYKRWKETWIVVGRPVTVLNFFQEEQEELSPEDTILIAKGLPEFFERVIQAEGQYYFDEPNFVRLKIADF